jgi:hypothetical protein
MGDGGVGRAPCADFPRPVEELDCHSKVFMVQATRLCNLICI